MKTINCPVLITEQNIIILKGSKRLIANRSHPNFNSILERVRKGSFSGIETLFKIKDRIEKIYNVKIKNGNQVFYKNKPIHNVLTEKILAAMRDNLPYRPYIKFMDRLMENPSDYCKDQLFNYVERYGLALDANGMLYGYKTINSKFMDKYTNTISYSPGKTVRMDREKCDQNEHRGCSTGLHVGECSYVLEYGDNKDDKFVLIKFSPRDVLACPTDCDWKKLRVCKLTVVRQINKKDLLPLKDKYLGNRKATFRDVQKIADTIELYNN